MYQFFAFQPHCPFALYLLLLLARRMMMVKQSLAFVVLALACSLCFTPCTESLAVGNEGKRVGRLVLDVENKLPTNPRIQNHGPNEVTTSYQEGVVSPAVPNQVISTPFSPKWCIAKPSTSAAKLDETIRFCCSEYAIDCAIIQYGGPCYNPATNKVSDASVVMNLYYKITGKNDFDCYFQGSGLIVTHDPSVGECLYAA